MCPLHPEPPSHLPPHPTPPGCHRAPALGALCHTSNLHWLSVLHTVMYMFQFFPFPDILIHKGLSTGNQVLTNLGKGWRVDSQLGFWNELRELTLQQSDPPATVTERPAILHHSQGYSGSSGDLGPLVFSDENGQGPFTLPEIGCVRDTWSLSGLDHPCGLSLTALTSSLFQTWLVHSYLGWVPA